MSKATATSVHPFEEAGLGLAPFKFMGMYESRGPITLADGSQVGAPGQPMGTCKYCGQGIAICCSIESSDGKRFIVGSDCVAKVTRDDNRTSPILTAVEQWKKDRAAEKREAKREAAWAKAVAEKRACKAALDADVTLFTDAPHPNTNMAANGKTLRDYYTWCLSNGGASSWSVIARKLAAVGAK